MEKGRMFLTYDIKLLFVFLSKNSRFLLEQEYFILPNLFWKTWWRINCKAYLTDPASKKAKPHCIRKTMHPITIRKKASTLALTEAKSSSSQASKATAMIAALDSWRRSIYVKLLLYSFSLGLEEIKSLIRSYGLILQVNINCTT